MQLNWSAPSYIGLLILFAGHIPAFSRVKRRVLYFGMGVGAALTAVAYFPSTFGVPEPFKNAKSWRQPIEKIGIQAGHADFILTSSYDLAAELAYYWPRRIPVYVAGNAGRRYNQHDLWPSIDREAGRNGVYINTNPSLPAELAQAFERCSPLPLVEARSADGRVLRTFYTSVCSGYRPIAWPKPSSY
ncbi:MAG: hypothetical protein HYX62_03035 [Gammaproteobacteria bacterium]|nr:hypothetical protein [Gammaproteobacteria bacterium]